MGGPKLWDSTVGSINNSCPRSTNKIPNCVFEGSDGNKFVVCAIKKVDTRKYLLIDYNFNRIKTCNCALQLIFINYILCLNVII
jgi:hypothetical protein